MRYSDDEDYDPRVHGEPSSHIGAALLLFAVICGMALIWISRG